MSFRKFFISTILFVELSFTSSLWSAEIPNGIPNIAEEFTQAAAKEIQNSLDDVERSILEIRGKLQKTGLAYYRLKNSAGTMNYLWENESLEKLAKKKLLKYSELEIKSLLRQFEVFETRKEELIGDLELLKLREEENKTAEEAIRSKALNLSKVQMNKALADFSCAEIFAESDQDKLFVERSFGNQSDKETGLSWHNSGWWLKGLKAQIRACSKGHVIFSGKITGRGRVLLLEHGSGRMSLYANMSEEGLVNLTKGAFVEAGTVLGKSSDKFFFEIRENGNAIDPKRAFSKTQLERFRF